MDHVQSSGSDQSSVKPQASPFRHTSLTLSVLQAEAGLVALSHLGAVEAQQVIVSEDFHAVVVPVAVVPNPRMAAILGAEVRLAIVVDLGGEA